MKKIYAVNSGVYSDYRIVALFEFMSLVPSDYYNDIEEYELNPNTSDLIKRGYSIWSVDMLRDGTTERVSLIEKGIWERSKSHFDRGTSKPDILRSTVWARSEKEAVKITNEYRLQMIALDKWK